MLLYLQMGIYRAPNKDKRLLEKMADQTRYMGKTMKEVLE
jgi:hypothetical protein